MSDLADRIGGWAAERVMRWIAARAEGTHREWVAAMRAEMACMDDGVERLRWTLGGVVMAWRMGESSSSRSRNSAALTAMPLPERFVRDFAALVVCVALIAAAVRLNHAILPDVDQFSLFMGCVLCALVIARHLAAKDMVVLLAGQFVFMTVTLVLRSVRPPRVLTSAGSLYFAMMAAATIAAIIAARRTTSQQGGVRRWISDSLFAFGVGEFVMFGMIFTATRFRSIPLEYLPGVASHIALLFCGLLGRLTGPASDLRGARAQRSR